MRLDRTPMHTILPSPYSIQLNLIICRLSSGGLSSAYYFVLDSKAHVDMEDKIRGTSRASMENSIAEGLKTPD